MSLYSSTNLSPAGAGGPRGSGTATTALASTGRVASVGGDPADAVRVTLAALNARAQQLVNDDVDHRVVCSGRSLFDVSRRAVAQTARQVQQSTSLAGGDGAPNPQASVQLFMSRHLGFDAQEQQRLLQQLHASQAQMAADIASTERLGGARGVGADGVGAAAGAGAAGAAGRSIDALVAQLKGGILAQAERSVHERQRDLLLRHEGELFKAAWSPYYVGMADDFETLALRQGDPAGADHRNNTIALAALRARQASGSGSGSGASSTGLMALLNSGSPVGLEMNRKIAAFAPIVSGYPPSQWISRLTAYVQDRVVSSGDELAVLWATAERLLAAVDAHGSGANTLSYVAASRAVLEEKALGRVLTTTMNISPARVEEAAGMQAGRVLDIVARATGTTNVWAHILEAMRIGRFDAAAEAAKRTGSTALEAALRTYADAAPKDRVAIAPALELRELYAETRRPGATAVAQGTQQQQQQQQQHGSIAEAAGGGGGSSSSPPSAAATQAVTPGGGGVGADVHRQAVLFLLLAGATGESADASKRVLFDLCSRVGRSIEDVLWMRLFCVRAVEETARGGPIQSLAYVQRIILDDLQDLVTMAHGNIQRIASFLIHAMLPSSGLRLLLENDVACVDGLHLALCFNHANVLRCSPLESPVDVAKHLSRYCATVLLELDRNSIDGVRAGASTFDYFHKTGFDEAFSELCLKDVVATRLFGQRGTSATGGADASLRKATPPQGHSSSSSSSTHLQQHMDGLLLSSGRPVSSDLMRAMSNTAELAASRSNAPLALHLLLALARACLRGGGRGSAGGVVSGRGSTEAAAYATAMSALQRAVKLACPAMAQAFYAAPHTSYAGALFGVCAQLHAAVREAGADALCSVAGGGSAIAPEPLTGGAEQRLPRADLAAFEILCTMADVFLSAHAAHLEQALRSFFALPFVPGTGTPNELDNCVAALSAAAATSSASGSAVATAAGAIVPLAFRVASSLLQVYTGQQQHQQQVGGAAAADAAAAHSAKLRHAMQVVCAWLRRGGSQPGGSGVGVSLYEACLDNMNTFEYTYLR